MALGTNYKRTGRKQDLILRIQIARNFLGQSITEARESTKGYPRKDEAELVRIFKEEEGRVKYKKDAQDDLRLHLESSMVNPEE